MQGLWTSDYDSPAAAGEKYQGDSARGMILGQKVISFRMKFDKRF